MNQTDKCKHDWDMEGECKKCGEDYYTYFKGFKSHSQPLVKEGSEKDVRASEESLNNKNGATVLSSVPYNPLQNCKLEKGELVPDSKPKSMNIEQGRNQEESCGLENHSMRDLGKGTSSMLYTPLTKSDIIEDNGADIEEINSGVYDKRLLLDLVLSALNGFIYELKTKYIEKGSNFPNFHIRLTRKELEELKAKWFDIDEVKEE